MSAITYRMQFQNIEQKLVTVLIEDRVPFVDNPYNIQFVIIDNGDTTQTVTFTWDPFPVLVDGVIIGYRSVGGSYTDDTFSPTSPHSITIPLGDYEYHLTITYADDSTEDFEFLLPQTIDLQPGGDPLHYKVIDNNEDKFTQIKAKQVVIQFLSDANYNMNIFADGPEDRFKVTVLIETQVIFYGFLTPDDLEEAFLPPTNVVTLIASDKLGALKDIPLTDDNGDNPLGKYRLADFISLCLKKTGLNLPIRVINNLRHGTGITAIDLANFSNASSTIFFPSGSEFPQFFVGQIISVDAVGAANHGSVFTVLENNVLNLLVTPAPITESGVANFWLNDEDPGHIYDKIYLDAKTFESKIGESEDCAEVLEKILGEDCFVTQYKGEWLILRVDELDGNLCYVANFTQDGVFVDIDAGVDFIKSVGFTESLYLSQEETTVSPQREFGVVRENYKYTSPEEIPCNIDFSRGDVIDDSNPLEITYELDCWTQRRGLPGFYNTPITITDFITRVFDNNDYEKERYISITPETGHAGFNSADDEYIESEAIPVSIKDKFSGSIDWRLDADIASSSATLRLFRFVLIGDDGSGWILGEATVGDGIPVWYDTSGWTLNSAKGGTGITFGAQDETEWQNISWEVPPIPVTGNLYIWIGNAYQNAAVPSGAIISYSNLNITYTPYINGSYRKYISQYNKVSRSDSGYLAKREKDVYISDSPKKLFKGAMFYLSELPGGVYKITQIFYDASKSALLTPASNSSFQTYGWLQAFSVWNQFRNSNRIFKYTFQGDKDLIGFGEIPPDLINKYEITDVSVHSNDRYFMMLHFDHDLFLCESKGVLAQVFKTDIPKVYTDVHEFKYESENR